VPPGARACPECGADEDTGWSQGAYCDRLGIPDPDEEFDREEFVKNEFGPAEKPSRIKVIWIITALVLAGLLLLMAF
jgi:hypothetical protein